MSDILGEAPVELGPAVAEEAEGGAVLLDLGEVDRGGEHAGLLGAELGEQVAALVADEAVAVEALAAYLQRRREVGSPEAIRADVDPRNVASRRLLERHGFVETHRKERTWNVGGEWCDSIYFELRL